MLRLPCAVLSLALAALASLPVLALAQQKLLPAQSEISFTSRQMGVLVDGRFPRFDAQLAFDPKKPEAAKIAFTVDLDSVSVGDAETVREVRKPGWFDTAKFPKASFASGAVKALGGGRFEVAGTLTIKGVARPVTVPVALAQSAGNTTATGSFVIKRLDFRIGDGDWSDVSLVANEVTVKLKLVLAGVPAL